MKKIGLCREGYCLDFFLENNCYIILMVAIYIIFLAYFHNTHSIGLFNTFQNGKLIIFFINFLTKNVGFFKVKEI